MSSIVIKVFQLSFLLSVLLVEIHKNTGEMRHWQIALSVFCFVAIAWADVPASCAKPFDQATIEDLLKASESWKGNHYEELRAHYAQWLHEHDSSKTYGISLLLPSKRRLKLSWIELTLICEGLTATNLHRPDRNHFLGHDQDFQHNCL